MGVRVRRHFGARGRSSVRYGTRLGDLKENWFPFVFQLNTQHTLRVLDVRGFSGTLAFSLRLAPFLPASDSPALHTGSSASPSLAHSQFLGLAPPPFLLTASSDTLASSLRLMPPPLAIGALSLRPGSSAHSPTTPPSRGPISSNRPPRSDLYYVHLQ